MIKQAIFCPRFSAHPVVSGDGAWARFYISSPLLSTGGQYLGSLCLVDSVPRTLGASDCALLSQMAETVVRRLESNAAGRHCHQSNCSHSSSSSSAHDQVSLVEGVGGLAVGLAEGLGGGGQ